MSGKARAGDKAEHVMTFRMSEELYQKLVEAAGKYSVSEEIRGRLEASFVYPDLWKQFEIQRLKRQLEELEGSDQ